MGYYMIFSKIIGSVPTHWIVDLLVGESGEEVWGHVGKVLRERAGLSDPFFSQRYFLRNLNR